MIYQSTTKVTAGGEKKHFVTFVFFAVKSCLLLVAALPR